MKTDFEKTWISYVKRWNKEKFDTEECLGCSQKESLEEMKDYIIRCINDEIDKSQLASFPISYTYSSKGKTEAERLIYLVEESARLLNHAFMCSIIFDGYNIKHGAKGLLEIIAHYVTWVDAA